MALLASTVLTSARILLNDPSGAIYPDAAMYPLLNKAYRELQVKLTTFGISTTKEIFTVVAVNVGTTSLSDGAGLPTDLIYPIELFERAKNSTEFWKLMQETNFEPNEVTLSTFLNFWTWREDEIKFIGALTDRDVKIRGIKSLGSITSGTSPILILDSDLWIAQRAAAIAALTIGANPTRAQALQADLDRPGGVWDDLKIILVRRKQNLPVRRMRTRYRRM